MTPYIVLYEDNQYQDFFPLTALRPVMTLRAGILPLYQRLNRFFEKPSFAFICREQIAPVLSRECRDVPINIIKPEGKDVLLLNGRIRDYGDLPMQLLNNNFSTVFKNRDQIIGYFFKQEDLADLPNISSVDTFQSLLSETRETLVDSTTTATLYNRIWELMADIGDEIKSDFTYLENSLPTASGITVHEGVHWVDMDNIYLGHNVTIMPGAMLDASNGPIYIGDNTTIESFAAIYGPTFIGPNSVITQGKITSCSIGHTSRVGGEVEETVFQAYVNKYHAGFIGHSYVGQWVNFGAMTTNSDLKNNYSEIRTRLNGKGIMTGSTKVGSFIGDHTKFGIGTLLNTGINIGICCNLFGGTLITDKEVSSFSWGQSGNYKKYDVDKIIETAQIVCNRRNVTFTPEDESLIRSLSEGEDVAKGVITDEKE